MIKPAIYAEVVVADIVVDANIFSIANFAGSYHAPIKEVRILKIWSETDSFEIKLILIVVFLFEVIFIPLEFLEKEKAPSQI